MFTLTKTSDQLVIQQRMHWLFRAFLLALALFPLLAPYELLIKIKWQDIFNLPFLFVALICAGALVVSAFLVWAGIAGLNTELRFDRTRGSFTHSISAPVLSMRTQRYPLSAIHNVDIQIHEWSEGEPSYALRITLHDGKTIATGSVNSRTEIEQAVEQVQAFLNIPTGSYYT
jgi:hypothetical protein